MLDQVAEDLKTLNHVHHREYVQMSNNQVSPMHASRMLSSERLVAKYANDVKLFNVNCRENNCANGDTFEGECAIKGSYCLETKHEDESRIIEVTLQKGVLGLGFCIDGGMDTPTGSAPITVKRLFKGNKPAS